MAIGILFIILSYFNFTVPYRWWLTWGSSTSNALGTTLVASAVVSFILELSNLKGFIKSILANILNDEFPFEAYSNENLEKFHIKLVAFLCGNRKTNITDSDLTEGIYAYEEKIRGLATSVFYAYHDSKYFITPDEKNGIFKVKAEVLYKVINKYGRENSVKFKAKTFSIHKNGTEDANNFKMNAFSINGREVDKECVHIDTIPEHTYENYYDYKITIDKSLGKLKMNEIKMEYEYNIPISDKTQSYKVTFPCKKLNHRFKIYEDCGTKEKWCLHADAFAAFYCRQNEHESKFKVEQNEDDLVKIVFDDWVFPGSGYVVSLKKMKI